MIKHYFCWVFVLLLIIILPSCRRTEPVTDADAKELAMQLEKSVRNENPQVLYNIFDRDGLKKNIQNQGPNLSSAQVNEVVSTTVLNEFGDQIIGAAKDGSYKMIRIYDDSGRKHMLFRMFGEGGLNYHDYTLIKVNGSVKADDLYTYLSGEEISKTLANLISVTDGKDASNGSDEAQAIVKIADYKKKADYTAEINLFKTLDSKVQKNKSLQLLFIDASKHISDDDYKHALEGFAALYPNDPNTYLLMLDVYYLNKEFDKAMFAINKLDSIVKGDPLLDLYRGNIYKEMGQAAESRASYEKCFAYDPYIKNNMQQLAASYADSSQYDKAKAVITKYKQNPKFKDDDITPLYTLYPALKDN